MAHRATPEHRVSKVSKVYRVMVVFKEHRVCPAVMIKTSIQPAV